MSPLSGGGTDLSDVHIKVKGRGKGKSRVGKKPGPPRAPPLLRLSTVEAERTVEGGEVEGRCLTTCGAHFADIGASRLCIDSFLWG